MTARSVVRGSLITLLIVFSMGPATAQLFENLEAFGSRLDAGDPAALSTWDWGFEGPKGIAAGDLDGSGTLDLAVSNLDGSITIYLDSGGKFASPLHLGTAASTLRGIAIADLTGDALPDIAAAGFHDGIQLLASRGSGAFLPVSSFPVDYFARNLVAADFDGDGRAELVAGGSGAGVVHYRPNGEGTFSQAARLWELDAHGLSKPVYSFALLPRLAGPGHDLVATHAWSDRVWILGAGAAGALELKGFVPGFEVRGPLWNTGEVYALDAGPITSRADSGFPDLVTAHRDRGVIQVRRATATASRFEPAVHQEIAVPGGPRAVRIADLDGDGWNDVAVVLRYLDRVLTFRNQNGLLVAAAEMPVGGRSPRDLVSGDFNRDGRNDLAVINRATADVTVLHGHPDGIGFQAVDGFYLVDGEVAGLVVKDFNGDGRSDVIQIHRASGDLSLRTTGPDGVLAPPVFHAGDALPSAQAITDVNGDDLPDAVVANLGTTQGFVTVRLGQPGGGLGPEERFAIPSEVGGRLFALEVGDFDKDGDLDLATGFMDCRLGFFRNLGGGLFKFTREYEFVYEARVMASGDFDRDGDVDLAGAGYAGHLVVVENHGDLLTAARLDRDDYPPSDPDKFGTTDLKAVELNADGDLDLLMGSGNGVLVFTGSQGVSFLRDPAPLPGTGFPASSLAFADFDGDGQRDLAVACQVLACVSILTSDAAGRFVPALSVDVPAGRHVAAGDLDGDDHADLVGTGEALWTALSSRQARAAKPPVLEAARPTLGGVAINELLAINNELPLASDGGRMPDWLELHNGGPAARSLAGWTLVLVSAGMPAGEVLEYRFPPDAVIPAGGHLLIVYAENVRTPLHTGFRLPGEGGTLTLIDETGATADRVEYPPQRDNISYARYRDGVRSFVFNNFPSPARTNADNGPVPPLLELEAAWSVIDAPDGSPRLPAPGEPIRFLARAQDDVAVVSASILYQWIDAVDPALHRVILYDDGLHADGAMQDGLLAGILETGMPPGGELRLRIEASDLSDHVTVMPDGAGPGGDEDAPAGYTISLSAPLGIELSEVVPLNETGLRDEGGGTPDWVEIRNCSNATVSLEGYFLGERFPADDDWFAFPAGSDLAPGEHLVVACDGAPEQGPFHAPFKLDGEGGRVFLIGTGPRGGHAVVDSITYGAPGVDQAYARLECGGRWEIAAPTPGLPSGVPVARGDVDRNGSLDITDPILILSYLFRSGRLSCLGAADVTGEGQLNITDPIHLLAHLFRSGAAPAAGETGCRR